MRARFAALMALLASQAAGTKYTHCTSSADCEEGTLCYELTQRLPANLRNMCLTSCSSPWDCIEHPAPGGVPPSMTNPPAPAQGGVPPSMTNPPAPVPPLVTNPPATNQIPNAAASGTAYCRTASSDPDGDGWGWENEASCIVYKSGADNGAGTFDYCVIGTENIPLCTADTGSWGSEGGTVCLSRSMCPGMGSPSQAPMRSSLVNPSAAAPATKLYAYLQSQWGKAMISGQQDQTWKDSIDQFQRVVDDTGKAPAIMGYDYMNYGTGSGGLSGLAQTEEGIAHAKKGGIVSMTWHWRDPDAAAGVIGEFYTKSTDFRIPIKNGALDTASPSFTNIMADIDMIAKELKKFQDAGVPVLWRPLHEAAGGWFWWGAKRDDGVPAAFAQVLLWKHLYTVMTKDYGLNNLIWVWNGQSGAWYPGDDYCDIVSYDVYATAQDYGSQIDLYTETAAYPHQKKIVALSENSNIPDPDSMAKDGAWWSWFMVWNDGDTAAGVTDENNFWTGEHYNTNAHKKHVYNHPAVITLDELPAGGFLA